MKKLLIVVDFQTDFVNGSLGFKGAEELEGRICDKIMQYQKEKQDILFTYDTHEADYLSHQEGRYLPIEHCIRNTTGWELYGNVARLFKYGIRKIEKKAFGSIDLGNYLIEHPYDQVELVGLVSNICVLSNVVIVKSALPEAKVIVDASCTASADKSLHEKGLDVMAGLQVEIINR